MLGDPPDTNEKIIQIGHFYIAKYPIRRNYIGIIDIRNFS